jgi:hypothetical protein
MPFDSQIRLRQLHNPELSGFVVDIITKYLTGSGVNVNTGSLTGAFYPLKQNPSGYLTSISTGGLVDYPSLATSNANLLAQIDLLYYPRINPSGFGTGNGSGTSFSTGDFASIVDENHNTGFILTNNNNSTFFRYTDTGFYIDSFLGDTVVHGKVDFANANISGYSLTNCPQDYTNSDVFWKVEDKFVLSLNPIPKFHTALFTLRSPQYTGLFYDVTFGKFVGSGISGWGITGTNSFALLDNRSGIAGATGFKYWQGKEYYQSGSGTKIDFYKKIISGFEVSGYLSTSSFVTSSGYLQSSIDKLKVDINALSGTAVLDDSLVLTDESGWLSLEWGYNSRNLWDNQGRPSASWLDRQLIGIDDKTVDWRNRQLWDDDPTSMRLDWHNLTLSGIWNAQSLRTDDLLVSGQSVLTGSMTQFLSRASGDALYYPTGNPNNYVTASYVSQFATKTDAVSRSSLSQNQSLHLTDNGFNNLGFKYGEFFYIKGPSGQNVIDFYFNSLTGFDINAKSLKVNGTSVLTSIGGPYLKLGVASQNSQVMFNGQSQTVLDFLGTGHFYIRDNDSRYLIDVYGGEIQGFSVTASGLFGYYSATLDDYLIYYTDNGPAYINSNDGLALIDLSSNKTINGFSIDGTSVKVSGNSVITQIFNTGIGSGIFDSTDGLNTAYLKTLIGNSGINISGSGKSLILTVTGIGGNSVNTGQLTGEFYPLTGNPSGFITSSQTEQFASTANLNSTGNVIASWTGTTPLLYYPRNTNPSGFLTSLPANLITGNGTIGFIPKFTGITGLANSIIFQSGNFLGINKSVPLEGIDVSGNIRSSGLLVSGNAFISGKRNSTNTLEIIGDSNGGFAGYGHLMWKGFTGQSLGILQSDGTSNTYGAFGLYGDRNLSTRLAEWNILDRSITASDKRVITITTDFLSSAYKMTFLPLNGVGGSFANGFTVSATSTAGLGGNVGVNTNSALLTNLGINGNAAIGSTYFTQNAPTNGLIVQNSIGVNTTGTTGYTLNVQGSGLFASGLLVSGKPIRTYQMNHRLVSGHYSVISADDIILASGLTTGHINVFLPSAATTSGQLFRIKRIDSGNFNLVVSGNWIDGETGVYLPNRFQTLSIISDGSIYYTY